MNSGDKLHINVCSFDDLLGLPSVGKATAYTIWELRNLGNHFSSQDGKSFAAD
jgi:DNA uptake protein ComE-like DNA-binding protein